MKARTVFWLFIVLGIICVIGLFVTSTNNQVLSGFFIGSTVASLIIAIFSSFEWVEEKRREITPLRAVVCGIPKAKWVLVHDDGFCADGSRNTVLVGNGGCPVCDLVPDMQSTSFVFYCPTHDIPLKDKKCPTCGVEYDTSSR